MLNDYFIAIRHVNAGLFETLNFINGLTLEQLHVNNFVLMIDDTKELERAMENNWW